MPRPKRIEFDGAWYHVMNRGARRWNIFHDNHDRKIFLGLLGKIRELWNVEVHAYSLMDNHFHLMVHTPNSGLSKAIKYVSSSYAQYYNRKYHKDGPLFRSRFKSIVSEKDNYLIILIRYIHLNPVKAKLCRRPEDHAWTSHRAYFNPKFRPDWLVVADVLNEFAVQENTALKKFNAFVNSQEDPAVIKYLEAKRRIAIFGSEGFKDWIKYNFISRLKKEIVLPTQRANHKETKSNTSLLKYVLVNFGIKNRAGLLSIKRNNHAKIVLIYLMRTVNGASHQEIANFLDMNTQAVSKALQRMQADKQGILFQQALAYKNNLVSYVQV